MRRSASLAALVLLGLAACGGEPPPGLELTFQDQALLSEADVLAIYFYRDAEQTCTSIRAALPRPPSVLGPYLAELNGSDRLTGVLFRLSDVPPGTYVVYVDAQTRGGANVGSGCTPGQRVLEDQLAPIQVVISDNP